MLEKKIRIIGIVLVVTTILLIFWFSSKSREVSLEQSDYILLRMKLIRQIDIDGGSSNYSYWNFLIRKGAHFIIFIFLGAGIAITFEDDIFKVILLIVLLAISDEVHQFFSERGAMITDIVLDIAGGFTGWFFVKGIKMLNNKR